MREATALSYTYFYDRHRDNFIFYCFEFDPQLQECQTCVQLSRKAYI